MKRFMIAKNSVVKIQNLVLNQELRPVKSNGFYQIHHVYRFKDFGADFIFRTEHAVYYGSKNVHYSTF